MTKRHKKRKNKPLKQTIAAVCRDCGHKQEVARKEWDRAARPRCLACGGLVDPQSAKTVVNRGLKGPVVIS